MPVTKSSICTGGTAANEGNYERSSDPWVAISPDGTTYLMTLSVDTNPGGFGTSPNAMLVMRSQDGGLTWEDPTTLKRDENPNVLNDKNSMTADPHDPDFAYAIWDRLVSPPGEGAHAERVRQRARRSRARPGSRGRRMVVRAGSRRERSSIRRVATRRSETRSWSPRAATWSTRST